MSAVHLLTAALAALALAGPARSAAPTMKQLETAVIQQALGEDDTRSALDALATAFEEGAQARIEFLRSLLADIDVGKRTAQWLPTVPDTAEVPAHWARHFRVTMEMAVRHLDDAEIDVIFGRFIAPAANLDETRCARLFHAATPTQEVSAALGLTRNDVTEFYRIVARVYSAASSDRPAPPGPSAEALQAALRDVAQRMPASTRAAFADSAPARQQSKEERGCLRMRAAALALKDVPGESGRIARRDLVATMMLPSAAPPDERRAPEVRGAASARFQPGPVALQYPAVAARAGIEGRMTVRIWVDAEGRATQVQTIRHSFNPPEARLADGTTVTAAQLFEPVVSSFYKAGRFALHLKDGVAQAYLVEVPLEWRLD